MKSINTKEDVSRITAEALIPHDTVFNGDMETKGNVRIDGHVKGCVVAAGNVMIGTEGSVEGGVTGIKVCIAGKVSGNLNASGPVELLAGSRLVGDLHAVSVSVEKGAYYKGKSIISDKQPDTLSTAASSSNKAVSAKTNTKRL